MKSDFLLPPNQARVSPTTALALLALTSALAVAILLAPAVPDAGVAVTAPINVSAAPVLPATSIDAPIEVSDIVNAQLSVHG